MFINEKNFGIQYIDQDLHLASIPLKEKNEKEKKSNISIMKERIEIMMKKLSEKASEHNRNQ
ncbi:MAG: hypothetical protein ACTSWX_13515 [Promethearchaeota archaeon]